MFVSAAMITMLATAKPRIGRPIWNATRYGHQISWSTQRLLIRPIPRGEPVYLAQDEGLTPEDRGVENPKDGEVWDRISLLSVVGPLVTVHERSYLLQGNGIGSSGGNRYTTIDLSRGGKPANLTDYFPEEIVFKALLSDRLVTEALARLKADPPEDLNRLIKILSSDEEGGIRFNTDLLSHFYFHHHQGGFVAIRLAGWVGDFGAAHSMLIEVGLLLPVPAALKQEIEMASKGKGGFMRSNVVKVTGGEETRW